MTNTSNAGTSSRASLFRAPPLPEGPGSPQAWPDRAALLRAQAEALKALMREDLSRGRGLAFLVCAAVVTLVAVLAPVLVVDAATGEGGDTNDVAVSVAVCVLLAVIALPALLVLRSLRARGVRRRRLLGEWAAIERGCDSEIPSGYGSQGSPHSRFINAAGLLVLVFVLAVVVLANASDASGLVMLPGLVVAGAFAWATVRKYADRYTWASRENVIRGRARRRQRHRGQMSGVVEVQPTGVRPALLYIALCAPVVIVALVFAVARPKNVLGIALVGLVALAVLLIGAPVVTRKRRRERDEIARAADTLVNSFPPGAVVHPMRYGLGEPTGQRAAAGPASWDCDPPRAGALAVGGELVQLRGVNGDALDIPFADLAGVACMANTVTWLDPTLDLLLRSGDSIEVRTPRAEEIAGALSGAGVRTVSA
ncbi:hypothetical protein [Streptomyces sp. Je 1-369]|uniref:hypothetical protein n=1 Tax=Streptomyces sp. Je 1-369 TaxID=2966192 RepID=UPI0022863F97|nr:hypothetical protein [Streptomyces sp. Je 1-369]WAL95801.1 hypothetical protein NOO62_15655 [Streptomyces sp. Je 1-369]